MSGTLRTTLLLAALTALVMVVGWLIGGVTGTVIALVIALGLNLYSFWNADSVVLRMYGAREVTAAEAPDLVDLVAQLARRAELPMPRVFIIDSAQPNAFATGRDPAHGAVAATTGLLHMLSREELAGVMAHELAHVKNRDTLIMTITATLAGALSMIANFGLFFGASSSDEEGGSPLGWVGTLLMAILAPLAAMVVQMAISRGREYQADRQGAEICGHPLWLASALRKLETGAHHRVNPRAEHHPATAHLFIVNPLSGRNMDNLFSTHPNTANRIARLEELAGMAASPPRPWGSAPSGPWG